MIGSTISHYRILAKLGGGTMGVVYRAEDTNLGRQVAIKFLPPELAVDRGALERFVREARAASALNNPHICTIHDLGEHEGRPFLVMELLEGETLGERLTRGPLSADELVGLALQLTHALGAAHRAGIVHRDLKPANIFLTESGVTKVLDFGLAKRLIDHASTGSEMPTALADDPSLTSPGSTVGTVAYMSPEQVRGEIVDARTDLFSLGVVLYQAAAAQRPFDGATSGVIFSEILSKDPPAASRSNPELQPALDRILAKLLEKDRELRYQSATEVTADLKRIQRDAQSGVSASALPPAGPPIEPPAEPAGPPVEPTDADESLAPSRGGPGPTGRAGRLVAGIIVVAVLSAAAAIWWQMRSAGRVGETELPPPGRPAASASVQKPTVAVLPFQDLNGDPEAAYLSVAVPDQIISELSRVETLAVRPFAATARYSGPTTDLAEAGAAVRAVHLVTGQYFREGDRLRLTMETVDVESGRLLWRESLAVPGDDLLSLREQVGETVRGGLILALAPDSEASTGATAPTDPEAYELYLESLAIQRTTESNRVAITMLERSVELDPGFAPAWAELAERLHYDAMYAGGGEAVYEREAAATEMALSLDPLLLPAAVSRVVFLTDEGKLSEALDIADALVARHPRSAEAHFARGYARRYASLVDGAIADCEQALALDPTNYRWRSCANAFGLDGNHDRAAAFLDLDRGSDFYLDAGGHHALSRGDPEEALRLWSRIPEDYGWTVERDLLEAHLAGEAAGQEVDAFVTRMEEERDAEPFYWGGALLVFVGAHEQGFGMVRQAIERNYCAATGLEKDRFWEPYRDRPEYREVLRLARECRDRFASGRG